MRRQPFLLRLVLLSGLVFCTACATSRAQLPTDPEPQHLRGSTGLEPRPEPPASRLQETEERTAPLQQAQEAASPPVLISTLPGGPLRLSFPASTPQPGMEKLGVEDIRPLLAALGSFRPPAHARLRLMTEGTRLTQGPPSPWELRLRGEFLSQYGPVLLPLPESLESSRLYAALKLSTRYMDDGIREAAQELFSAPAFLASVSLSVLVYFAAWLAPEPFFSKAFAATLTVRLSLLVGLVELSRVAMACLALHREAEIATTPQELEAAAERFGKSIGGTGLRVLVVVASLGLPQVLPKVPKGGLETLLSPLRHAPAGGPALESIATAQVVADGTLLVTGVAAGTSAASLCGELVTCAMMNGGGKESGGGPKLSTRYGKPHTRQNPPHNEAIEEELARREAAGHTDLRKNKPQQNAGKIEVRDRMPTKGDRLDGTLVRRYVPSGVSFP